MKSVPTSDSELAAQAERLSKEFTERYGEDYSTLSATVIPYLIYGCSWGFISNAQAKELGIDRGEVSVPEGVYVYPLSNGYLVYLDYTRLVNDMQSIAPLFSEETIRKGYEERQKGLELLNKQLSKGAPRVRIGFFNLNESSDVTIKGTRYKSYRVDIGELCDLCTQHGYNLNIRGTVLTPDQALANLETHVFPHLVLAPSNRALMIELVK